jgi:hypothetical protein
MTRVGWRSAMSAGGREDCSCREAPRVKRDASSIASVKRAL